VGRPDEQERADRGEERECGTDHHREIEPAGEGVQRTG
jgi:hypothetical protein